MLTNQLKKFIQEALTEDIKDGDHTSLASISKDENNCAELLVKDNGIIAGIELAEYIFKTIDSQIIIKKNFVDGDKIKKGDIAFTIEGNAIAILSAERLVLNCMQRMSAISSKTADLCKLIADTKTKILDTRKTTPLNRYIEKWAVRIGGGLNHRFGLYDAMMIKDNHIDFAGSLTKAIHKCKEYQNKNNLNLDIIVEARNIIEVREILLQTGIKRILLDNFDLSQTKEAVNIIAGKCETESSGSINKETIREYALCGVDYISVGELTHSVENFDLSLNAV